MTLVLGLGILALVRSSTASTRPSSTCAVDNELIEILEAHINLSTSQLQQAWRALLDSFDYPQLERFLYFRLDKHLAEITPTHANFADTCFKLLRQADRGGWLEDLILAAADERPRNEQLELLAREIRIEMGRTDSTDRLLPRSAPDLAPSVESPEIWHQSDPSAARRVFVSYSHKDERHRQRLEISLAQLQRDNLVAIWHDRKILPGQEWNQEIDRNLEGSDIILLLISPDFLASKYAYGRETVRALERHQSGSATVVPIILRPSDWQHSPLASLQALPSEGRPVSRWSDRDQAWLDVAQGLRRLMS
jgi:hypothetical protein